LKEFGSKEVVMKILLAVDGSPNSEAAISEVAGRPWPPGSEVRVITAVETPVIVGMEPWAATPVYFEQLEKSVKEGARSVLDAALSKLSTTADKSLKVGGEVLEGPASQMIVDEAQKWGADLIVMGSRGLGAWNRLFLGSVSSAVVHHAKCSVEIVRFRPGETTNK
jgi:nucleotide-binding universal stress UspA family protein